MTRHELAVIGAGPAGLAAAVAAADSGVSVALIDAAPDAGGQYYRQTARQLRARRPERLYHAWSAWKTLRDRLAKHREAERITFLTERQVWHVEPGDSGFVVHALTGPEQQTAETIAVDGVVLATGGYERVLPFPGWTLPGVLTAGGAQAMLKAGLVLPGRRVVVAGSGPLLLPVAGGLAAAGAEVVGLYDASDPRAFGRHLGALSRNAGKLVEGAGYAVQLARHGVRVRFRCSIVAAHGRDQLEAVTIAGADGHKHRIACDALAVSHGMLPHTEIAQTLGARLTPQGTVAVDTEQRTDLPHLWAAGETTGIGGAALSQIEGEIAGRSAAARLRGEQPDGLAGAQHERQRLAAFADVIGTAYTDPAGWVERVEDDTVLCRCEEVTAASVREAVSELGATDLRTIKLLTRAGMGWCQGRICGPGVAGVAGCPLTPAHTPFARPVPLGVLAQSPTSEGSAP
ncbi:MAG TPA: FAD-dependent oxidoreductase [Actinospica sp.]|nr:FAD-dependent oxidoreductase [Actinospica sp.]